MEDTDQAVDVAQVAPAFQAEGSAQAGASTQENPHPPTLAEIQANPIGYRRYVSFLANNTPPAPSNLSKRDLQIWKHYHLLKATLDHLITVARDKGKPVRKEYYQKEVHCFFNAFLIVNHWDYNDSPFYAFKNAKTQFRNLSLLKNACKKMEPKEDGQ